MIRTAVQYEDGFKEVHFAFSADEDMAICGADLAGDDEQNSEHGSYDLAKEEKHTDVNCVDCLRLVVECKKVRLRKFER